MDLPLSLAQATVQSMSVPQSLGSAVRHTRFILRHALSFSLLGKGPCRGRAHYRHNALQQLHQQAFHFGQPPTAFHSRGTRPSPRTVVLRSPFPSQRARSKSAPPQLKFNALAFPPWLWEPALAWSWSQPRQKLGTRWSWREGRRLTSSLCSLPPCACDGTTHPPSLPQKGATKQQLISLQRLQQPPCPKNAPDLCSGAHRKSWSTIMYSFNGLAVVIVP